MLRGRCAPTLLRTYSAERQAIAKELIESTVSGPKCSARPSRPRLTEKESIRRKCRDFVKHGHYTVGTATRYKPSLLFAEPRHQHLAKGFVIGMRFHSAPVIRLADAKSVRLGDTNKADGRCAFSHSPMRRFPRSLLPDESAVRLSLQFPQGSSLEIHTGKS